MCEEIYVKVGRELFVNDSWTRFGRRLIRDECYPLFDLYRGLEYIECSNSPSECDLCTIDDPIRYYIQDTSF